MFSCTFLGSKLSLLLSNFLSTPFLILSNRILQNIFLVTGSKLTLLQLLYSCKLPFLNILTTSFFHSFGHLSLVSLLAVSPMSPLNNSGHTSSTQAAFPGFVVFNASLTYSHHHLPRSISSISSDSTISSCSTGFVGSSLFNISLKCSTHLCSPSSCSCPKHPLFVFLFPLFLQLST